MNGSGPRQIAASGSRGRRAGRPAGMILAAAVMLAACSPSPPGQPTTSTTGLDPTTSTSSIPPTTTSVPATTSAVTTTTVPGGALAVLEYLRSLTAIRQHAGWRNSGSAGESEALDFVSDVLGGFSNLQAWGLELERQSFPVFVATEPRQGTVLLTVAGQEIAVAADAPRGHRFDLTRALRFDSDGVANDADPDPLEAEGGAVIVRTEDALDEADISGAIVFLDYAVVSPASRPPLEGAQVLDRVIAAGASGVVLVTSAVGGPAAQPGWLAGDGTVLENVTATARLPVLNLRLEDCAAAGITDWEDLDRIEMARLVWDADVYSPGTSGNLVARIPGADPSHAIILGAHIDGPNSPAALDDGANAAVLLETARRLDEAGQRPPIDVYLVWLGSEELWLYGALHFVETHQELLDRAVGALLLDAVIGEVLDSYLSLDGWSYSRFGDSQLAFPRYLEELVAPAGISFDEVSDFQGISSDNAVFSAFLPQAGLAFGGSTSGYGHTPYDTWEAAAAQAEQIGQVAEIAFIAATEIGHTLPDLRVTPEPAQRALIVGSHTQVAHMGGAALVDLAMALAWEGFDVDTIPYGQEIGPADLEGVSLVVVLPVIDYADDGTAGGGEGWTSTEVAALVGYVEQGGLLVLTNSARHLVFGRVLEANEDWDAANALAAPFGISFTGGAWPASSATVVGEHPLLESASRLVMIGGNGVQFTLTDGTVLAAADGQPAAALVEYGPAAGQVLVLADEGMLDLATIVPPEQDNLGFLRSLAAYAADR